MIHLYVKQHNVTGLKYFGMTKSKDPIKYPGSGLHWKRHCKIHGKSDITTTIVGSYDNKDIEIAREFAIKFSADNNIVESEEWANLIVEDLNNGFRYDRKDPEIQKKRVAAWQAWYAIPENKAAYLATKRRGKGSLPASKGNGKGTIVVKNSEGHCIRVDKNDPRVLSGEYVDMFIEARKKIDYSIVSEKLKRTLSVKDKDGNRFRVSMDDPRYKSGELVHHNTGKKYKVKVKS